MLKFMLGLGFSTFRFSLGRTDPNSLHPSKRALGFIFTERLIWSAKTFPEKQLRHPSVSVSKKITCQLHRNVNAKFNSFKNISVEAK